MNWKKLDSWSDIPKDVNEIALDREGRVRLQRRQGTVNGWKLPTHGFMFDDDYAALNLTPYIPTTEAVPISPAEAAARMVNGLPVEYHAVGSRCKWQTLNDPLSVEIRTVSDPMWEFRIPACPPAKQKLTIEVDAGVKVSDEILFWNKIGFSPAVNARVIHREGAE